MKSNFACTPASQQLSRFASKAQRHPPLCRKALLLLKVKRTCGLKNEADVLSLPPSQWLTIKKDAVPGRNVRPKRPLPHGRLRRAERSSNLLCQNEKGKSPTRIEAIVSGFAGRCVSFGA